MGREDDNTAAVVTALAMSLALVMSAFAGPEFEEASTAARCSRSSSPLQPAIGPSSCSGGGPGH